MTSYNFFNKTDFDIFVASGSNSLEQFNLLQRSIYLHAFFALTLPKWVRLIPSHQVVAFCYVVLSACFTFGKEKTNNFIKKFTYNRTTHVQMSTQLKA